MISRKERVANRSRRLPWWWFVVAAGLLYVAIVETVYWWKNPSLTQMELLRAAPEWLWPF